MIFRQMRLAARLPALRRILHDLVDRRPLHRCQHTRHLVSERRKHLINPVARAPRRPEAVPPHFRRPILCGLAERPVCDEIDLVAAAHGHRPGLNDLLVFSPRALELGNRVRRAEVKNKQNASRLPHVQRDEGLELLLPGRVPDIENHCALLFNFDPAVHVRRSDSRRRFSVDRLVVECVHDRRLSDAAFANRDDFELCHLRYLGSPPGAWLSLHFELLFEGEVCESGYCM